MSRLLGFHDDAEDVVGDGTIELGEDHEVLLSTCIIIATWRCAVNMLEERKLAEHGGEEHAPFGIVRGLDIKNNRNISDDTHNVDSTGHRCHGGHGRHDVSFGGESWRGCGSGAGRRGSAQARQ